MANVIILGGGFGGLVAAEQLAQGLRGDHHVTLISREDQFVFYPDLVRVAFGKREPADIAFDLREALTKRNVRFIQGEVARVNPETRHVVLAHGEVLGELPYDYLIFALGRRLATELIPGFFEQADHLLTIDGALQFGESLRHFKGGRAVVGQCVGARLPVPVYETAFALRRLFNSRGLGEGTSITILSPDPPGYQLGDAGIGKALRNALDEHNIEFLPDFKVSSITPGALLSDTGQTINYRLLMLVPPFEGPGAMLADHLTDTDGYIKVDRTMRVSGCERMYAVGDCVSLPGPKMAHMAVHQAEIAAANLVLELSDREPSVVYSHELMMVIDEGGANTIFIEQDLDRGSHSEVRQNRFWSWAKWVHDRYWQAKHF